MTDPSGSDLILPDPPTGGDWPGTVTVLVAMLIAHGETAGDIRAVLQALLGLVALLIWSRARR